MQSYNWTGDAAAIGRYGALQGANKVLQNAITGETASMTAGSLGNRILDIEGNPSLVKLDQLNSRVTVEQPAGTEVARFTPTIVPPFGTA